MRKLLLLAITLFLLFSSPAFGLIVTDNVHRDKFQYEVAYQFATDEIAASQTKIEVPIDTDSTSNFYFVIPRDGRVVGISVAGDAASTRGGATFDVTINGAVTGVQAVIAAGTISAVGNAGSSGPQYSYIRQDRTEQVVHKGFNQTSSSSARYDNTHPYGKATPITAGNRIGVKVTTDSTFLPIGTGYVVVVYVLQ